MTYEIALILAIAGITLIIIGLRGIIKVIKKMRK